MVRNWQSRVEIATARRNISKQKKSKMDQKRQWKASIQEFQTMIDRIWTQQKGTASNDHHDGNVSKMTTTIWKIHIWTDTAPLSTVSIASSSSSSSLGPSIDEDEEEQPEIHDDVHFKNHSATLDTMTMKTTTTTTTTTTGGSCHFDDPMMDDLRKRMRSKSLGDELDNVNPVNPERDSHDHQKLSASTPTMTYTTPVVAKGRARSNSTTASSNTTVSGGKKKKIHPRSHWNSNNNNHHYDSSCNDDNAGSAVPPVYICRSFFYTGSCQYHASSSSSSSTTAISTTLMASPRGTGGRKGGHAVVAAMMSHHLVTGGSASMSSGCRHLHGCCSTSGTIHPNICLHNVVNRSTRTSTTDANDTKQSKSAMASIRKDLQQSNDAEQEFYNNFGSSISEAFPVRDVGAMDMLHHFEIEVEISPNDTTKTARPQKLPSERISETITKLQLYLASITYITVDTVLVYDRYRNGLLFNTEQELVTALIHPENRRRRGNSMGDCHDNKDDTPSTTIDPVSWAHIPDTILVQILTYLPDNSVAPLSRVCKQWYHDIQTNSIIWRNMLDHRDWPHPPTTEALHPSSRNTSNHQTYRDTFCRHYTVLRDMKALRFGLDALIDTKNGIKSSQEMTYRKFANTTKKHHSPTCPTTSIGVRHWSPNRTLVAYDRDCTVRLFESQPGGENGHTVCKEIICQKLDPYRNTKKRTCTLQSVDLDEQSIACIGKVTGADERHVEAYVLLVMSRDDFLLGDTNATTAGSGGYSDDISKITVIDIGEAILHYLYSLDHIDGSLVDLMEFLMRGGSIGDINIIPTCTVVACGKGRFMLALQLFIPLDWDEFDDTNGRLIDKRVYLFSSMVGAIVWSYEIDPYMNPQSRQWIVSCFRRQMPEGYSKSTSYFAVYESIIGDPFVRERVILLGEIDSSGSVQSIMYLTIGTESDESSYIGWCLDFSLMILSPTDIVLANLIRPENTRCSERKIVVSFCDRSQFTEDPAAMYKRSHRIDLEISGVESFKRMCLIRDDYIALVCQSLGEYVVVVVHVPSRKEVCRTQLCEGRPFSIPDGLEPDICCPWLISDCQETVALSASFVGVVMTGRDVRQVIESSAKAASKQKKKPHLRNNQGYKKDGFRLGKK